MKQIILSFILISFCLHSAEAGILVDEVFPGCLPADVEAPGEPGFIFSPDLQDEEEYSELIFNAPQDMFSSGAVSGIKYLLNQFEAGSIWQPPE